MTGVGHPSRLRLSPREVMEALAYHNAGSVRDRRDDWRAAMQAYVFNRTMGGKVEFEALMPHVGTAKPRAQTEQDMKALLKGWNRG